MRLIKDSRGVKSWHLTLGIIWTTLFSLRVLIAGINITLDSWHIVTASIPGSEYALYISPWLAAMGWREYQEKKNGQHPGTNSD